MKKILISVVLMGTVFLTSCYNDKEEQLYPNSNIISDTTKLTYNNSIKLIIDNNCATSCHNAGGNTPNLSNYSLVNANKVRIKARAITQKNMPAPSGMSSQNILKLENWINNGALEN